MISKYEPYFRNKVSHYDLYRPEYPDGILRKIEKKFNIDLSTSYVAEFGSGTGKFTRHLSSSAKHVIAIEPEKEMIDYINVYRKPCSNVNLVCGTAEESTLPDDSVDFVFAAQAFHYFNINKATHEFQRILKPRGKVFLIWYFSNMDQKISSDIRTCFYNYKKNLQQVKRLSISMSDISSYFPNSLVIHSDIGEISQVMNYDEFIGSMFSSSYAPQEDTELALSYKNEMNNIFLINESGGYVECFFNIHVYMIEMVD